MQAKHPDVKSVYESLLTAVYFSLVPSRALPDTELRACVRACVSSLLKKFPTLRDVTGVYLEMCMVYANT